MQDLHYSTSWVILMTSRLRQSSLALTAGKIKHLLSAVLKFTKEDPGTNQIIVGHAFHREKPLGVDKDA